MADNSQQVGSTRSARKQPKAGRSRPILLPGPQAEVALDIDGRRLKFTNLDKVFYPREGYRKRDVINYYEAVSPLIVPHLTGYPLSLKRYPNGIEGKFFFQKN